MIKIESLEEVRSWKEKIYQAEKNLSKAEKLKKHKKEMALLLKNPAYAGLKILKSKNKVS